MTRRDALKAMALGAAALAYSACGAGGGGSASGKIRLVWMVRNDPVENPWERDVVIPQFEKRNPNISIELLSINQDDIAVKRQAMLAAKEPLHVWSPNWGGDGFGSDRVRGLLQNLSPLMRRSHFDTGRFIPGLLDIYSANGNQYGIPQLTVGSYTIYNKKLFDESGVDYPPTDWDDESWTWEKFIETARKLTKNYGSVDKGQYGATVSVIDNDLESPPRIWGQNDVWPKDAFKTGFATHVTCTDERSVASYQAFHDIVFKEKVAPSPAIVSALANLGGTMPSGKVAMEIQGGWDLWVLKGQISDPNGFCIGIAPIPFGAPGAKLRSVTFTDPWSITNGLSERYLDASWKLVEFLVSPEQARIYMEKTGTPPAQKELLPDYYKIFEKCMKPEDMKTTFEGAFTHGRESSNHLIVKWDELNQIWSNNFDPFFSGASSRAADMLQTVEFQTSNKLQEIRAEWKPAQA